MCHTEERNAFLYVRGKKNDILSHTCVVVCLCDSQPENPIVLFWDDEPNDVMTKRSSEAKREKKYNKNAEWK
jgi:hypothetical protein